MAEIKVRGARIRLQFHGLQGAVPVEDLRPGMVTIWNAGYTREVAGVIPSKSGKTFQLVYAGGRVDRRRFRRGTLIAIDPDVAPLVELEGGVTPGNTAEVYHDLPLPLPLPART